MPVSAAENEFVSYVLELTQTIGPVTAKRMFGGHGLFLDGLMFALIMDSSLYLKADKVLANEFESQGLSPFTYTKNGKLCALSYYQAPEDTLEDAQEMNVWANKAYAVALAAATKKTKKS